MANVAQALRTHLLADTAVAAIVGTRIYHGIASDEVALPYITFAMRGKNSLSHAQGGAALAHTLYEVNSWSGTAAELETLRDAVRESLANFRGVVSGVDIRALFLESDVDFHETRESRGRAVPVYSAAQTYRVSHVESVPVHA